MLLKLNPEPPQSTREETWTNGSKKTVTSDTIIASSFAIEFSYFVNHKHEEKISEKVYAMKVYVPAISNIVTVSAGEIIGMGASGRLSTAVNTPYLYYVSILPKEFDEAVDYASKNNTGIIDITPSGLERAGIRGKDGAIRF